MRIDTTLMILAAAFVALACDSATRTQTDADAPNSQAEEVKLVSAPPVQGYLMARWNDEIPKVDPGECPDGFNVTEQEYYSEEWEAYRAFRKSGGDTRASLTRSHSPIPASSLSMVRPSSMASISMGSIRRRWRGRAVPTMTSRGPMDRVGSTIRVGG